MAALDPGEGFCLGDWQVRPRLQRIEGPDGSVRLEPRVMQVLVCLCQHAGDVVSREALYETVWPDTTVTDEGLTRAIFDLRRALGDSARTPRYIETIHKSGYRLIAPVETASAGATADPAQAGAGSSRPPRLAMGVVVGVLALLAVVWGAGPWSIDRDPTSAFLPARALTSLLGFETNPALSPTADFLIYARDDRGDGKVDLFFQSLAEDRSLRLTTSPGRDDHAAVGPDARRVAFLRTRADGSCALMILDLAEATERLAAGCRDAAPSAPAWMPDGRTVLFADREGPGTPYRILGVELATGTIRAWSEPPADSFGDIYPAVSPDGAVLAVVRATAKSTIATYLSPAVGDIVLLPAADPDALRAPGRALTDDNEELPGLAWLPGGKELVFASTRGGRGYALWTVARDGGKPDLLYDGQGRLVRNPSVAARAGHLAFESWRGAQDVWRVDLETPGTEPVTGRRLLQSTRSDFNPQFSPRSDRIAFASSRSGSTEIWTADTRGGDARRLSRFGGQVSVEAPRWSPDGQSLVFEGRSAGRSGIWRVEADGGGLRRLTKAGHEARAPSWSLGGRRIYFASDRQDSWQVWSMPAAGGEALRETVAGGFASRHARLGGSPILLVSRRDRNGIWAVSATGGSRRVADLAIDQWGNWELADGAVVSTRLRGEPDRRTEIWSTDLETSAQRRLVVLQGWISRETPSISVSPDGRSLLFARFEGLAADVLLMEPAATSR